MKKIFLICLCFVLIFSLSACGSHFSESSAGQNAYDKAESSLSSGNYDRALRYFKRAKDEGIKTEDIDEIIDVIDKFIKAKELFNDGKSEEALKVVNSIPSVYRNLAIKNDVNNLKDDIQIIIDEIEKIDIQIENTENLFASGDYEQCSINIDDILANPAITSKQRDRVEMINRQLTTAQNKINGGTDENTSALTDCDKASDAVENFVYAYATFVLNGDRTSDSYYYYMSDYSPSWSNAYKTQWNYFVKHNITSYDIDNLAIDSVSQSGDTFYVTDTESIGETQNGKFVKSTTTWVYTVQRNNETYIVTNYGRAK